MSRSYNASQCDSNYLPHKLSNWEVPDTSKVTSKAVQVVRPSSGSLKAEKTADGRTIPIVNEKGHIVRGGKKKAAFVTSPTMWQQAPPRWPAPNPTFKGTAGATMGYKGIQTAYLPSNTVPIRTVEIEGAKDFNFQ